MVSRSASRESLQAQPAQMVTKKAHFLSPVFSSKPPPLAKSCFIWLPVLYYMYGSLKGRRNPLGIEAQDPASRGPEFSRSKRPKEPVRD